MKNAGYFIFPFLFCVLFSCFCWAESIKIDSLSTLLKQNKLSSAQKLELLSLLGYEYWTVDPRKSVDLGREALKIAVALEDEEKTAFNYRVIGVAYWALGDYVLALDNMLKSLDKYQHLSDKSGIGSMLMNIGLVYSEQLSYAQAKKFYRHALIVFEEMGESGRKATTLTKIASVLTEEDSLDLAHRYLNEAIEIHRENDFQYGIAEAYNRLGILYRKKNDLHAALDYLYRSRDISRDISDREGLSKCFNDIGKTFFLLKKYLDAEKYYQMSLQESFRVGSKKWRLKAYHGLYELSKAKGENARALQYLEFHQVLHDSILNEQAVFAIVNMQEEFTGREQLKKLEISKAKIEELQQEAAIKKLTIFSLIALFLLTSVILFLLYRYQKMKRREAAIIKEREYQLMESEKVRHEIEFENSLLRESELKRELELKNKELTSYALNFMQKNDFLDELKKDLQKASNDPAVLAVKKKLHAASRIDQDWDFFRIQFEQVHEGFLDQLKALHPHLSQGELRHSSLIRLNMNTKECAAVLGISVDSAKTSRYRLRKKMGLEEKTNLFDYLLAIGK